MFEMSSVSCNAPIPGYTVNHSLIKTVPLLLDTLVQLFYVLDLKYLINLFAENIHCEPKKHTKMYFAISFTKLGRF